MPVNYLDYLFARMAFKMLIHTKFSNLPRRQIGNVIKCTGWYSRKIMLLRSLLWPKWSFFLITVNARNTQPKESMVQDKMWSYAQSQSSSPMTAADCSHSP